MNECVIHCIALLTAVCNTTIQIPSVADSTLQDGRVSVRAVSTVQTTRARVLNPNHAGVLPPCI